MWSPAATRCGRSSTALSSQKVRAGVLTQNEPPRCTSRASTRTDRPRMPRPVGAVRGEGTATCTVRSASSVRGSGSPISCAAVTEQKKACAGSRVARAEQRVSMSGSEPAGILTPRKGWSRSRPRIRPRVIPAASPCALENGRPASPGGRGVRGFTGDRMAHSGRAPRSSSTASVPVWHFGLLPPRKSAREEPELANRRAAPSAKRAVRRAAPRCAGPRGGRARAARRACPRRRAARSRPARPARCTRPPGAPASTPARRRCCAPGRLRR
jgi:hypothetical protein